LGDGEGQIPALEQPQPTLGFLPERYGGDSGCNFDVGVYNSSESSLSMETPATTGDVRAESREVQEQESVYMSSLATVTSHAVVDDKLQLYSSSEQMMLTMQPMERAPLQDTVWSLQLPNVETQWPPLIPGSEITMKIDGDELSGSAVCNENTASISEEAGALTIGELTITQKACEAPAGAIEQEQLYLSLPRTRCFGQPVPQFFAAA
jgi:heat shock protein HslJ